MPTSRKRRQYPREAIELFAQEDLPVCFTGTQNEVTLLRGHFYAIRQSMDSFPQNYKEVETTLKAIWTNKYKCIDKLDQYELIFYDGPSAARRVKIERKAVEFLSLLRPRLN